MYGEDSVIAKTLWHTVVSLRLACLLPATQRLLADMQLVLIDAHLSRSISLPRHHSSCHVWPYDYLVFICEISRRKLWPTAILRIYSLIWQNRQKGHKRYSAVEFLPHYRDSGYTVRGQIFDQTQDYNLYR